MIQVLYAGCVETFDAVGYDVEQYERIMQMDCDKAALLIGLLRSNGYAETDKANREYERLKRESKH